MEEVKFNRFLCDKPLSMFTDSMLFDSHKDLIAEGSFSCGDKHLTLRLVVNGEVCVEFDGVSYHAPSEFPDVLREAIKQNPETWERANTVFSDGKEHDLYVHMNNWFEYLVDGDGSFGVTMDDVPASMTPEEIREEMLGIAADHFKGMSDKTVFDTIIGVAEELCFSVTYDDINDFEFEFYSPAGEDCFCSVLANTPEDLWRELEKYANEFDVDEHVKSVMGMNGAPDISVLCEDAKAIQEMLQCLADTVHDIVYGERKSIAEIVSGGTASPSETANSREAELLSGTIEWICEHISSSSERKAVFERCGFTVDEIYAYDILDPSEEVE